MMWPPKWSPACSEGGNGQCDGSEDGYGMGDCRCPCHNDPDLPMTVPAVQEWHDEMHGYTREES